MSRRDSHPDKRTAPRMTEWMAQAVRLARSGLGATYPNPCVGAVVAKGGRVLGTARSRPTGGAHAETQALAEAGRAARGATLVVTLEPCCHHGRTPPCTDAIVAAGIRTVVVGVEDPAPHVAGQGLDALRRAGVQVVVGVGAAACEAVHEHYLHHVRVGLPFVSLKAATSIDGRIATASGDSKWITSEASRRYGHRLRAWHHAIAVGARTVLADDPGLDVRLVRGVDPQVVVFDGRLRLATAPAARVLRPGTLVLHTERASRSARARVAKTGATLVSVADAGDGRVELVAALRELGRREIRSLLVEGGGRLLGAFVAAGAWQRAFVFQAPRLLGEGLPMVAGVGWSTVDEAPRLRVEARRRLGPDLLTVLTPEDAVTGGPSPGPDRLVDPRADVR
ncbi:bifunctional diaminohydroxyphosphoribosylaminopyrimidine deaminase/5-amino-6-(5-phosphoribosylamino)uracil reductase RibD [Paraliomyxa miuraensis]|uniref:bifunctional diaminohydroxyphosphoribosylaminopyrimidine deaminase/5-amino-6-(5-phosphoribosylamino)uracil reductase RibD n=1 Tax=Paraliomyxa miuraensis TaxID=376150 RepID=UPI00225C1FC5|nr:bifunctional diaminohydroxyphosphoribosylaminopyrimidine deaminase/5-amino-6-(5-phosphoribosylamino)uracil reductase RibD [Paraliomyxa miuraensis]MCX4244655.1 bifunctional diaminohydroxyphosphoribosylaminopyrimidine deaminase/5-amino-6-(5-phosphoribosylamino)uracil reductase RibD [Paraliomyxa miuraensis]